MGILTELFLTFAKIGCFTFGGGYAMLPLIGNACVDNKQWITQDDMLNITVIAESTPGPIAINCATFVGYKKKGPAGAAAATLGIVLPSFLMIYLIAFMLDRFLEITVVANAFRGIRLAVGLLVLDVATRMLRKMKKKPVPLVIMGCGFLGMLLIDIFALSFSSVSLMLLAGAVSLAVTAVGELRRRAGEKP